MRSGSTSPRKAVAAGEDGFADGGHCFSMQMKKLG